LLVVDDDVLSLLGCGVSLVVYTVVVYDVWNSVLYEVESGIRYCISEYKIKLLLNLGDLRKQESFHVHKFRKNDATVSVLTSLILEGNYLGWVMCLAFIN
jgi:hypothetical protein